MRRLWILVPFWVFFLAYLVYFLQTRYPGGAGESVGVAETSDGHGAPERLDAPKPHLPEGLAPFRGTASPPRRVPEARPAALTDSELAAFVGPVAARVFVLPRVTPASPASFLWPVDAEGSPDLPELLALASRAAFPRWKLYEDEWVSFYYPDDPAITLELLEGAAPFPMIGETMWTVADSPVRRYRLVTTGGATFCMISLEKTGDFDDTPRFPKPEVFRREWVENGSLCRASLMSDGNLRRVEILAGGDRASVLDWPHCAVHRDVYERLALSVRLNGPVADGEMLVATRREDADLAERLAFLAPGMDTAAVTELLGPPTEREGDFLVYRKAPAVSGDPEAPMNEAEAVYRVLVAGGRFEGFAKDWRRYHRAPPETGSLAWMLEKTGGTRGDAGTAGYDLGPLTDEESLSMFDRFCAEALAADAEAWDRWCRVLANLAEMGAQDERILPHLGARFLDPALPQGNATQLLHAYDPERGRDLFAARLRDLLKRPEDAPPISGLAHELQVLFAYMGRDDARTAPLLDLAMRHADGSVRGAGYGFREWLPTERADAFLEHGLADPHVSVRRRCAEALSADPDVSARLRALVERRLDAEDDAETRTYLEEARRLHPSDIEGAARVPAPEGDDASS